VRAAATTVVLPYNDWAAARFAFDAHAGRMLSGHALSMAAGAAPRAFAA